MEVAISKKESIKNLWVQLKNDGSKWKFIATCANEFERSKKTIKQYWFSNYGDWSVPEEFQDRVIAMLQVKIALQKQ